MQRPSSLRVSLSVAIVGLFLMAFLVAWIPPVRAGAAIVFSEDFEDAVIEPAWDRFDADNASGLDYWGVSDFRAHGGNYSAWSAQVGNQSKGPNAGLNNSDSGVQEYDDDMQADLVIDLRVNGYSSLTLTFWYWARTESGGGDWIQAWYEAGGVQTVIFNPRGSTGNQWENITPITVPNDVERLIIRFSSDDANHGFEGAYVDDIVMTGIEDIPPASNVGSLPVYTNDAPFEVPYDAQDNPNASGIGYVELWYRRGTSGNFTPYNTTSNPSGQWTTLTVPFDSALADGDGYYEFYTVAVDRAGNPEAAPTSPDGSVTIDRTAPEITITDPAPGASLQPSVSVVWTSSDALSGIDHYEVSLDGGPFESTGSTAVKSYTGLTAGPHTVVVRAFDRAGNVREEQVVFDVLGGAEFPWWILLLLAAIVVAAVVFFVWWKRKKDEEDAKKALRAAGRTEEPEPKKP